MIMKLRLLLLMITGLALSVNEVNSQVNARGAELYQQQCAACHRIGQGKFVGPDLLNITEKRDRDWLIRFIRSSETLIKQGDSLAVAISEEYNGLLMPDADMTDSEIELVLQYIEEMSSDDVEMIDVPFESIIADATPADIELGRRLFEGRARFANLGTSCLSCHGGPGDVIFTDKSYSKDITNTFAVMGEPGMTSIITNPPFPVMAASYKNNPLKPEEVRALLAYLDHASKAKTDEVVYLTGSGFLAYSVLGAVALVFVFSLFWFKRKTESVNEHVFKRQIKSSN